eukprot:127904_1
MSYDLKTALKWIVSGVAICTGIAHKLLPQTQYQSCKTLLKRHKPFIKEKQYNLWMLLAGYIRQKSNDYLCEHFSQDLIELAISFYFDVHSLKHSIFQITSTYQIKCVNLLSNKEFILNFDGNDFNSLNNAKYLIIEKFQRYYNCTLFKQLSCFVIASTPQTLSAVGGIGYLSVKLIIFDKYFQTTHNFTTYSVNLPKPPIIGVIGGIIFYNDCLIAYLGGTYMNIVKFNFKKWEWKWMSKDPDIDDIRGFAGNYGNRILAYFHQKTFGLDFGREIDGYVDLIIDDKENHIHLKVNRLKNTCILVNTRKTDKFINVSYFDKETKYLWITEQHQKTHITYIRKYDVDMNEMKYDNIPIPLKCQCTNSECFYEFVMIFVADNIFYGIIKKHIIIKNEYGVCCDPVVYSLCCYDMNDRDRHNKWITLEYFTTNMVDMYHPNSFAYYRNYK